ncbi:MAG TPA: hypothetical protein VMQ62_12290 [Dongiaceae bacterium]|nr:hypothetical protein [Dongiaceae bacterium]
MGREYVLFLRRTDRDEVRAAQIGRSYWPLIGAGKYSHGPLVTPVVGLLDILEADIPGLLGTEQIRVDGLPLGKDHASLPVMYLHVLVPAVKSIWHERQATKLHN